MKRRLSSIVCAFLVSAIIAAGAVMAFSAKSNAAEGYPVTELNFPDEVFRKYVSDNLDRDGDGILSYIEIETAALIDVSGLEISDLTGIGRFRKLRVLDCSDNNLTELDVSKNGMLISLDCSNNPITKLTLENKPRLDTLDFSETKVRNINLSGAENLKKLVCAKTLIVNLDLTNNTKLVQLDCQWNEKFINYNSSVPLDLSKNTELKKLDVTACNLQGLDLTNNTKLEEAILSGIDLYNGLDLSNNVELVTLDITSCKIRDVDVSNNTKLKRFVCNYNPVTSVKLGSNDDLEYLSLEMCPNLKEIDISKCPSLKHVDCTRMKLEELDISKCPHIINATKGERKYLDYGYTIEFVNGDDYLAFDDGIKVIPAIPSPTPPPPPYPYVSPTVTPEPTNAAQPTNAAEVTATPEVTPAVTPVVLNGDSKDKVKAFIDRVYVNVLDREPEEEGSAYWVDELYNFNRTGAEVAQGFVMSQEFLGRDTSDMEFLKIMYKSFFDREPDETGMNYWLGQLSSGAMDRAAVANGFICSQEWADICASYGILAGNGVTPSFRIGPDLTLAFVERMYTKALGRERDEEGLKYWASALSNFEVTGEQVGAFFFLSDEMKGYGLSDSEYLDRLYATFMDRSPDEDGKAFWMSQMAAGAPRENIVLGFTRSPEFVDRCIASRILPY